MAGFGSPHRHLRSVDSTNRLARELAATAVSGTIVTASEQTMGRGRGGRDWTTPAGLALAYSAILNPFDQSRPILPIAVGLAVCEAVEGLAPLSCEVKWPNDVWVGGRKLAGILVEAQLPLWAVIGIGLNLGVDDDMFPPDLRHPATSVGHGVIVAAATVALNESLSRWVEADDKAVCEAFSRRDALAGRRIGWGSIAADGDVDYGVAEGIDEEGRLLVRGEKGELTRLVSEEVSLILG